jgi:hypothetical protein
VEKISVLLEILIVSATIADLVAPIVVVAIPVVAVLIGDTVAAVKAATIIVARMMVNGRMTEAPVPVRIGWPVSVEVVPGCVHSIMETLTPYFVVFLRRLLPSKMNVDLSIRLGQRDRANGHSRHQRGGREQAECGLWLLHVLALIGIRLHIWFRMSRELRGLA